MKSAILVSWIASAFVWSCTLSVFAFLYTFWNAILILWNVSCTAFLCNLIFDMVWSFSGKGNIYSLIACKNKFACLCNLLCLRVCFDWWCWIKFSKFYWKRLINITEKSILLIYGSSYVQNPSKFEAIANSIRINKVKIETKFRNFTPVIIYKNVCSCLPW